MYSLLSPNVLSILDGLDREDRKNTNPKEETSEQLTEDDFIPIITLDKSYKDTGVKYPAVYKGNVENKKTKLSKYLDNNMQPKEVKESFEKAEQELKEKISETKEIEEVKVKGNTKIPFTNGYTADKILAILKGERPNPSEYLPPRSPKSPDFGVFIFTA